MCYEVKCSSCGKTTWGGCGKHVLSVYRGIPEGQHCFCKNWPGVNPSDNPNPAAAGNGSPSSSFCTII